MAETIVKAFKRNDTGPPITVVCLDDDVPANLTDAASVKFLMGTINAAGVTTTKVTGNATFDPVRTSGKVHYDWAVGDLDTAGEYKAEVEITWASGDKQTYPDGSYLTIIVMADVG